MRRSEKLLAALTFLVLALFAGAVLVFAQAELQQAPAGDDRDEQLDDSGTVAALEGGVADDSVVEINQEPELEPPPWWLKYRGFLGLGLILLFGAGGTVLVARRWIKERRDLEG